MTWCSTSASDWTGGASARSPGASAMRSRTKDSTPRWSRRASLMWIASAGSAGSISCRSSSTTARWCTTAGRSPAIWRTGFPIARHCSAARSAAAPSRLVNIWSDTVLAVSLRQQIYADFIWCIDPGDRAYFRGSREMQLGMTLEALQRRPRRGICRPSSQRARRWNAPCRRSRFLAGEAPAYVDYVGVLGVPVGAHRQSARCAGRCRRAGGDT